MFSYIVYISSLRAQITILIWWKEIHLNYKFMMVLME